MGATEGFLHDAVDQPERLEPRCGNAHDPGGFACFFGAFPENRRATFGRNDRVGRILQHLHDVTDTDGQRSAGAAFADHRNDNRRFQRRHFIEIAADGLGLATLFGSDARVGTGRVDEGEDRNGEFFRQMHQAQGLAIAFRAGHAEVAREFFLGIVPLLMADDHHRLAVKARQSADDGPVIGKAAIAVQLLEIRKDQAQVIERIRPLRMPCHLGRLPRRQVGVDFLGQRLALAFQQGNLDGHVDGRFTFFGTQDLDLAFEFGNGVFKIKKTGFHGHHLTGSGRTFYQGGKGEGRRGRVKPSVGGDSAEIGVIFTWRKPTKHDQYPSWQH